MRKIIKYRVWDKKHKKFNLMDGMGDDLYLSFDTADIYYFDEDRMVLAEVNKEERYIMQQYTEFCDRNSKEIYEFDIIEFTFFTYGETELEEHKKGTIEIDKFGVIFRVSDTEFYYLLNLNFDSESDIKVIGNIYQDSHLLG